MQPLSGKKYMGAAVKGTYTDRVPVTILPGPFCAHVGGITIRELLTDAAKCARAQIAFYERFRPDSLLTTNDVYVESEAMGCELDFPEDDISHIRTHPLEDKKAILKLRVPEPRRDGRLPWYMEACERVMGAVRDASFGVSQSGPWNIAMNLRGHEALILDTADDPAFVHDLMRITTEAVKAFGDALIGLGLQPSIGEASASCSLISPKIYREFIQPYHRELREYFLEKKGFLSVHICGYIDPIAKDVIDVGMSPLSVDGPTSLEKCVALSGGRIVLMGNVPTLLFATGSREEMEEAVRRCIDTAAAGSRYILASGCEIPRNATIDRIEHYFEYSRRYGREFISRLREEKPELFS